MKLKKEFTNGFLAFLGIGIYFLVIDLLGLSNIYFLRLLNVVFILMGVRRTILSNVKEGQRDYLQNFISAMLTSNVAVVLSVIALRFYVIFNGGEAYVKKLAEMLWFGNNASVNDYCIGLLFEGLTSCIIIVFIAMQHYNSRFAVD